MAQDAEAAMIAFYILRGHSLDSLASLSSADKIIYMATMQKYCEEIETATKGVLSLIHI